MNTSDQLFKLKINQSKFIMGENRNATKTDPAYTLRDKTKFLTRFSNGKLWLLKWYLSAGGRLGGWAVGRAGVNISFPEHNPATIWNILMVLDRIIKQVNADCRCKNNNSACLGFLITSPYPYLYLVSDLYLGIHLKYFNDTL